MTKIATHILILLAVVAACSSSSRGAEVTAKIQVESHESLSASPANVVVWLTPIDSSIPRPASRVTARLLQKDKQFQPHLLVVPTGTSVEFPNMDPFFHNVFSLFNGKRFDLGLYETGTHRSVVFDREGISYIFCNIHPEMAAIVVTLNSPWFAISDSSGSIVIRDVPAGRYRLHIWAERLALSSPNNEGEVIDVPTEKYELGSIRFRPVRSSLMHHKNKFGKDYAPESPSPY
jgi:plastocyanin